MYDVLELGGFAGASSQLSHYQQEIKNTGNEKDEIEQ